MVSGHNHGSIILNFMLKYLILTWDYTKTPIVITEEVTNVNRQGPYSG